MRKSTTIFGCLALLVSTAASAEAVQTVTIDGNTRSLAATALAFNGDEVTITYTDNSTETVDMSTLVITFEYSDSNTESNTAISTVGADGENVEVKVYDLQGRYLGSSTDNLPRGLYIVNGVKTIIK